MITPKKFGFPEEWEAFSSRNAEYFEKFRNLKTAFDQVLIRTIKDTTLADKIILFLGRLCLEDFLEIMCLAANGYGYGALKLVRGLYERAVVTYYLVANPDETDKFLNYSRVEKIKGVNAWVEAYPDDATAARLLEELRSRSAEIGCEFTTKTWSGLDFVSMAKKTGSLGKMLSEAYYQPLVHAHGTAQAVISRVTWSEGGGFEFTGGSQPKEADNALMLSHKIMIYVLGAQIDHFERPMDEPTVRVLLDDFVAIWKKKEDGGTDPKKEAPETP